MVFVLQFICMNTLWKIANSGTFIVQRVCLKTIGMHDMDASTSKPTAHIDWYSFSIPGLARTAEGELALIEDLKSNAIRYLGLFLFEEIFLGDGDWTIKSGRRPYRFGYHNQSNGIFIWFGGQKHALVEVSGKGCQYLRERQALKGLLDKTKEGASRLDIAIDIDTDERPDKLVSRLPKGRSRARGTQISETGHTEYIGSKKSERYARVYRYNEPHPRADKLRIEFVCRKPHTLPVVNYIQAYGVAYAAQMLCNSFKFNEVLPMLENTYEKMPTVTVNRENQKTLIWLIKTCAPSFVRLVQEGDIEDPEEFLAKHFLGKLPSYKQLPLFEGEREKE